MAQEDLDKIIDFSANINPYGLSKNIKKAIIDHIDDIIHYPEPDARELCGKIAENYGISADKIIVGNGAVELLYILCHILKPKNALIVSPGFSEYERAAKASGANINYVMLSEKQEFNSPMRDLIVNIKATIFYLSAILIIQQVRYLL